MARRPHLIALLVTVACTDAPGALAPVAGPAPALASPNVTVGTTAGSAISYDASKAGTTFSNATTGGVRYVIRFLGASNGLTSNGAVVSGTPISPAVTRAVLSATDSLGRSAADTFAIVSFAPGLRSPTLPTVPFAYADADVPLPAHYRVAVNDVTASDNTPLDNPITNAGATLGRVLFNDMRLAANDGLSCAGCHSAVIGYSDTPPLSVGFAGALAARHTPGLVNARFNPTGRFFWDQRAGSLEAQVLGPIQNPAEMGMTLDDLVTKLTATSFYAPLFAAAFGSTRITSDRVAKALAQYVRSLTATNARYDRAFSAAGVANFAAVFTPQEIEGEALFRSSGCASCHMSTAMVMDGVHNIGLDAVVTDTGAGRGAFRAPSLRNVALRPRYMHDGRFTSLDQVVAFYATGVQPNPNLDARLTAPDGTPKRLALAPSQRAALVAFLKTLSDSTFATAPRFATPFTTTITPVIPPVSPLTPTASVTIQANAYHPPTLSVAAGTVVTWTNLDNARHSATFTSAAIGATPIFISGAQSLTMPSAAGTYAYHCAIHGSAMTGTITVR